MALNQIVIDLCNALVERHATLQLKGKKADDDAIAFLSGAAYSLTLIGQNEKAAFVNAFNSFGVAYRGMMEVRRAIATAHNETLKSLA